MISAEEARKIADCINCPDDQLWKVINNRIENACKDGNYTVSITVPERVIKYQSDFFKRELISLGYTIRDVQYDQTNREYYMWLEW